MIMISTGPVGISSRICKDGHQALVKACEKARRSQGDIIRFALEEYISKHFPEVVEQINSAN